MEIKPKKILERISRPESKNILRENHLRFDRNERTFLFDSDDFRNILNEITNYDLIAYPNLEPLYIAIANYHKVIRSSILLTAGGDYAIKHLFETYLSPGDSIVNTNPNYAMYSVYSKMFDVEEISINYNNKLKLEVDIIKRSLRQSTKILVLSNPGHNGIKLEKRDIIHLLNHTENKGILMLIDEAYIDFTKGTFIEYVDKFNNLFVLRTMSKGYGIASLRVSYLISSEKNILNVSKVKPAHELSGVSAKIAKYLIQNPLIKEKHIDEISKSKKFIINYFKQHKIDFMKTETNFVYFKTIINSDLIRMKLQEKNIYIKNAPKIKPFIEYLRLTIGSQEQMIIFTKALDKILNFEK